MKETKVYVDELPVNCDKCKYYTQFDNGMGCMITQELRPMDEQDNYTQLDCPLVDIKTHDRELVRQVCEKIKLKFSDTRSHNWGIEQIELYEFLDQIEQEFKDE